MKYGSVCSGVEAASVAWKSLGWEAQFFSEIEKFPSAVLNHHYPDVPNYGDMTKFKEWNADTIDLLVGGTPCQSFSIAGLRKGLADPRGNLMLTYLAMAEQLKPKWLVWENVPGVLSSNGGKDFGTFLSALGQIGYGFSWRILDAQYFGLAQRRKRLFVVGYLGDWRRTAEVLFEPESVSGHPAPSREARQGVAPTVTQGAPFSRTGNDRVESEAYVPVIAGSLDTQCGGGKLTHQSAKNGHLILEKGLMGTLTARMFASLGSRDVEEGAIHPVAFDAYNQEVTGAVSKTLAARSDQDTASCIAFGAQNSANQGDSVSTKVTPTLDKSKTPAVAYSIMPMNGGKDYKARVTDVAQPLMAGGPVGGNQGGDFIHAPVADMQVRRLTPIECERLQGFSDNYTQIPWRNKSAEDCPDGPRYKAMGNSMAVPVMRWIGERIQKQDNQ